MRLECLNCGSLCPIVPDHLEPLKFCDDQCRAEFRALQAETSEKRKQREAQGEYNGSWRKVQEPIVIPPQQLSPPQPRTTPTDFSEANTPDEHSNYITIKSPIIGTFYRKPSPDKPAFVEVGDSISEGTVLCVIEAMKLFNDIESEVSGKIVKVLVDDSSPVEFDQPLFLVDPS